MRDLNGGSSDCWEDDGAYPKDPLYYANCARRYQDTDWCPKVTVKRLRHHRRNPVEMERRTPPPSSDGKAAIVRQLANSRERERTQHLNEGFARLSRVVPRLPSDKMCKRQVLQLAIQYIAFLASLVARDAWPAAPGQPYWPAGALLTHERLSNAFCMSRLKGRF